MESRGGRPTKGELENDVESHGVNTENLADTGGRRKEEESIGRKENGREELKDETTKRTEQISYRKGNKIRKVRKYI